MQRASYGFIEYEIVLKNFKFNTPLPTGYILKLQFPALGVAKVENIYRESLNLGKIQRSPILLVRC